MDYGIEIAKAALSIGAIKLQPDQPFTWASGYQMPIYNDNRQLLASAEHRQLVTDGLANLLNEYGLNPDAIGGTSTAGIAPASSLAQRKNVPIIITHEGKSYGIHPELNGIDTGYDAIASTCPWAIPFGVLAANDQSLPFMYVRQKTKGHGLKQQIEGNPIQGQKVGLVNMHRGDEYGSNAIEALSEKGVGVLKCYDMDISESVVPNSLDGLNVPMIEDLISFGGSSISEIEEIRANGATCDHCFSIFSYDLPQARDAFAAVRRPIIYESLLTYDTLLEVALAEKHLNDSQVEMLQEWRENPTAWGEAHGFPKVEK